MTSSKPSRTTEGTESSVLVQSAFALARRLGVKTMLVRAEAGHDVRNIDRLRDSERIIWVVRGAEDRRVIAGKGDVVLPITEVALSRLSQIKIAMFIAVLRHELDLDESVVCLAGVAGSERLDTLVVTNPARDFPWFRRRSLTAPTGLPDHAVFSRLLDIALRFAREGREGQPIGTCFAIGVTDDVAPYTSQLILNPCKGHPRKARNIQNADFVETLRELTALDGAIVVSAKGIVESAGTYIDAPRRKAKVPSGLGARHSAAAALTAVSDAVAVVISKSSGTVTVFDGGEAIFELEKVTQL